MTRKQALKNMAGLSALAMTGMPNALSQNTVNQQPTPLKGNINHSVTRWTFSDVPLEDLCAACRDMGIKSVELLTEDEWPIAASYGLTCAMATATNIPNTEGFNNVNNHERLQAIYQDLIPKVGQAGLPNLICFSGNSNGLTAEQGIENCVVGISPLLPLAEQYNVVLCLELFNSKVDHPGYQADNTAWGVALAQRLDSNYFKLLYDIYHMQIMEGNIISTIRQNFPYIGHYHTAGVPGRNEINQTQELNYPAIMEAIFSTGFQGYVGHEFIAKNLSKLDALKEAIEICDI